MAERIPSAMPGATLQMLAARQIAKHGVDRYPSIHLQYMKLVVEVGELGDALLKAATLRNVTAPSEVNPARDVVISELCDVALSLAALANKLDINLTQEVEVLVGNDVRKFTNEDA